MLMLVVHLQVGLCWRGAALLSFDQIVEVAVENVKVQAFYGLIEPPLLCVAIEGAVRIKDMLLSEGLQNLKLLVRHEAVGLEFLLHLALSFPSF